MATGKYSHGKSKGTSDRKSSGRLATLGGTTGPIKEYDIKSGAGVTPQFKTITSDYYQSQPLNVPPAVQIPDAPQAPDDSQNLKNLAAAFGDVNTKLQAFIPDFWNFQQSMDKAARREAERRAAEGEEEKVNLSNNQLNKAKGIIETKAKTDPEAKAAYGLFASMDQRVEREHIVVTAKNRGLNAISNIENYALEIYENSLNDPSRQDESGSIVPVNPGTSEFTELLLNKIKGEIDNPQAYLELQAQVQAGILGARRKVSTIHAKYKDNKSTQTLNTGYGTVILDAANASQERLTGKVTEWTTDQEVDEEGVEVQAFTPLSFTETLDHFRLKTGTSIENYQKNTDPVTLLTSIATSTVNNIDRGDLPDAIDTVETMLMNTRLGAGDGQLLSEMVGGKEVLKKLWERAISNARNEAYKVNDLVAIDSAENQASTWAIKVLNNDQDANFIEDGVQEFGIETTYNMNGLPYKIKTPPNAVNLQGVLSFFAAEKKNAYKYFETGAEIRAYQKTLDEQLTSWLKSRGMEEQNANDKWLRNRILTSNNPIETKALIVHFGNERWISKDQKNLLLQDHTLKEKMTTQRGNFDETMKQPYKDLELKLGSLFQLLDPDQELEPEKWSVENQKLYRNTIQQFKNDVEETFGALNQDDYATRIEKIKVIEKNLFNDLDKKIEAARKGDNPYKVSPVKPTTTTTDTGATTGGTTDTQTIEEEGPPPTISKEDYNLLPKSEKDKYQPVPRGKDDRLTPGGGWIKEYTLKENVQPVAKGVRDYLDDQGLNNRAGFYGRGDDRANKELRQEVKTTAIYDVEVLKQQINRLEQIADSKIPGYATLNWEELSVGADFRLGLGERRRSEIDFKGINVILNRTGLTPREFFESQIRAHGLPMPTKTLDNLFPKIDSDTITKEQFERLSTEEKQKYNQGGATFTLKKNNKVSSSVLDRGTLVASTNLEGVLSSPKQEMETKMLDVIHSGESTVDVTGGGYEAFNQGGKDKGKTVVGFSGTYGDHPANKGKKLTNMTIQEILDIQDSGYDSDVYPWTAEGSKKWQDSGGIHAAGRYQLLRGAIRDAMEFTGIKPTEKFTPEIQDKLAIAYLLHYGPSKWTSMVDNKELKELLKKYKETDWTKSSTMSGRSDIA